MNVRSHSRKNHKHARPNRRASGERNARHRLFARRSSVEPLESRTMMATLSSFLTSEHADIDLGYSGGAWNLTVGDDDSGASHAPDVALLYVGDNNQSLIERPPGSAFDFTGVGAGEDLYRLPQAQNPELLFLGVGGGNITPSSQFDRYNPLTESKGRVNGNGRWVKATLVDVEHFTPDGQVGDGAFSAWQSGDGTPVPFMSNYQDGVSNPNLSGLDATDGIGADDALWIVAGGHSHFNFGFSEKGRYEVTVRLSGYLGDDGAGNASTPNLGGFSQSELFTFYFSVGSVGELSFDASSYTVNESAGTATVTVQRVGGSDGRITVDYAMANGSAMADDDYEGVSGTLTFNDQETQKTIVVPIVDDDDPEGDETINLTLASPGPSSIHDYLIASEGDANGLLGAPVAATLTILANDSGGNTPPTISDVANQSTAEDTSTDAIPFTVGDSETAPGDLVVTATSSDQTLIPDANIVLGGSGASRTVTITPAAGQSGSATITLTVSDGEASSSDTFVLTVDEAPAAPVAGDDEYAVREDGYVFGNVLFNDVDADSDSLTVEIAAGPSKGSVNLDADGRFTYTPGVGFAGADSFTYTVSDGSNTDTATVTIAAPITPDFLDVLTTEHVNVGLAFEEGEWDLHVHDETNDAEFAPDEALLYAGPQALTERSGALAGADFDFLGVAPGESFYRLPEAVNPELLFLGIGAEEIESGTFAGGTMELRLKAVSGPGHFSVWQSTDTGPIPLMATADGVTAGDLLEAIEGGHQHVNWGFTAAGRYEVTFEAVGTLAGGEVVASGDVTYYFAVDDGAPVITDFSSSSPEVGGAVHGQEVTAAGSFTNVDADDVHEVLIDWGDGESSMATVDEVAGTFTAAHVYATGGVFTVTATILDAAGLSDMLAAGATIGGVRLTSDGRLEVVGTNSPDSISITENVAGTLRVVANFDLTNQTSLGKETHLFATSDVQAIEMHLGGGDDVGKVAALVAIDSLLLGGDGNDKLGSGAGADHLVGGPGDDSLTANVGIDVLDGGDGDDVLKGGDGDDEMSGGAGADSLLGGNGNDTLDGGDDDDVIKGGNDNDEISGGAGADTLLGGNGNNTLDGGDDDDVIKGGNGDDEISGGAGADSLLGGNGNNTLNGGDDDDVITSGNDDDVIDAGGGDDTVKAGNGNNRIDAGHGNDSVTGGGGVNVIDMGPGDDSALGGGGDDLIRGGDGADFLDGQGGNDIVLGESGVDTLEGGSGRDLLIGGDDADAESGESGDDILIDGRTTHDDDDAALQAILAAWISTDRYETRVANLRAGPLASSAVIHDAAIDSLTGGSNSDWFWFDPAQDVTDKIATELAN